MGSTLPSCHERSKSVNDRESGWLVLRNNDWF